MGFDYKNYLEGRLKSMLPPAVEFIRRNLMYEWPSGIMRFRHYTFLSKRTQTAKFEIIRERLYQGPAVSPHSHQAAVNLYSIPLLPSKVS